MELASRDAIIARLREDLVSKDAIIVAKNANIAQLQLNVCNLSLIFI